MLAQPTCRGEGKVPDTDYSHPPPPAAAAPRHPCPGQPVPLSSRLSQCGEVGGSGRADWSPCQLRPAPESGSADQTPAQPHEGVFERLLLALRREVSFQLCCPVVL